jgi:flagellar protein FlgJ
MTKKDFIVKYYPFAKAIETETGLSAVAILAQAGVESNWGKAVYGNMFFGVKAGANWKGKKQLLRTFEYMFDDKQGHRFPEVLSIEYIEAKKKYKYVVRDWFRAYDTPYECFKDHCALLQKPHFAHAWAVRNDFEQFFTQIQAKKLKYSTSPTYAQTLIAVCKNEILPVINTIPS